MSARTPGPWIVSDDYEHDMEGRVTVPFYSRNNRGMLVTVGRTETAGALPGKENAAFIVEACNAYDTLRAQLDEAVALLRRVYPAGRNATHCDVDLRREACALLARVDGGAE